MTTTKKKKNVIQTLKKKMVTSTLTIDNDIDNKLSCDDFKI